jgi:hypothetical protein
MLLVFIALKNPSLSAGSEPANLGSNGKHNNHSNTENDNSLGNKQKTNKQNDYVTCLGNYV